MWVQVLREVRLGHLLDRQQQQGAAAASGSALLDLEADWASVLSLGEQQRLAFARCGQPWVTLSVQTLESESSCHLASLVCTRHRPLPVLS